MVVLGGTGHIGSAVARRFAEAGYVVLATGRSMKERPNLKDVRVQVVSGDDRDPKTVRAWLNGADVVVDAATPYPLFLHQSARSDVAGDARRRVRQILRICQEAGTAFVHISSFTTLPRNQGVLGQIRQGVLQGLHRYFDLKNQVEMEVKQALRSGLPGAVINPVACFGPYDLKPRHQAFVPMLLRGEVRALTWRNLNIVDVRDVADVVLASHQADYPAPQIPVFGHNVELTRLAADICARRGVSPPRIKVPRIWGLAGLYWMETAYAIAGRQTPWPSLSMMLLEASYPASPSLEQQALVPSLRPIQETVEDSIRWYEKIGHA